MRNSIFPIKHVGGKEPQWWIRCTLISNNNNNNHSKNNKSTFLSSTSHWNSNSWWMRTESHRGLGSSIRKPPVSHNRGLLWVQGDRISAPTRLSSIRWQWCLSTSLPILGLPQKETMNPAGPEVHMVGCWHPHRVPWFLVGVVWCLFICRITRYTHKEIHGHAWLL